MTRERFISLLGSVACFAVAGGIAGFMAEGGAFMGALRAVSLGSTAGVFVGGGVLFAIQAIVGRPRPEHFGHTIH